jgi:hypothetical protein
MIAICYDGSIWTRFAQEIAMKNRFEIVTFISAGVLLIYVAGAQLDWCDRGEVCRAVLPELPHGAHHDQRPHPVQHTALATSTADNLSITPSSAALQLSPSRPLVTLASM